MNNKDDFMNSAVQIAESGLKNGFGGPFGAVVVKDGEIIGRGCNSVLSTNDPTAHAEVMAIRDACKNLNSFQLTGCEIYTTCEPCPMCMGAIYWARPSMIYYASSRHDAANAGFDDSFIYEELNKDLKERSIPITHFPNKNSANLFEIWNHSSSKKQY